MGEIQGRLRVISITRMAEDAELSALREEGVTLGAIASKECK
jgi:hypothetical protein